MEAITVTAVMIVMMATITVVSYTPKTPTCVLRRLYNQKWLCLLFSASINITTFSEEDRKFCVKQTAKEREDGCFLDCSDL